MKLTPEEIRRLADAYWDEHYNGSKFSVVQVAGFGEVVQEALLAKLQNTKLEDLREEIAKQLFNDAWETCPEWVREYSLKKADSVLSLITPFLAVQLEAAEKAGMKKVLDWIAMHGLLGIYSADWQAFLKKSGIEVKS